MRRLVQPATCYSHAVQNCQKLGAPVICSRLTFAGGGDDECRGESRHPPSAKNACGICAEPGVKGPCMGLSGTGAAPPLVGLCATGADTVGGGRSSRDSQQGGLASSTLLALSCRCREGILNSLSAPAYMCQA